MRSYEVVPGQRGKSQAYNNLRHDARGGANLLAHQQLGALALGTAPTNGQTVTITINGTPIVLTAVGTIGTTAGNVLNPGTAAGFVANLLALLNQPQTTTSTGVALSTADQQLVSYLSWALSGTTITPCSNNTSLYAPLASFSVSTNVTSGSWTAQTMQLYVEPGVVYVNGTRVIFSGGSTPTVTTPSSHPRIDVLTIDNTGTLAWTTGTEASSPSAPSYPANKVPLCELYNVVGETALYDNANQTSGQGYISNDVRTLLQPSMNWEAFASDLVPDADGTRNLGSSSYEWNNLYVKSGIYLNGTSINAVMLSDFTAGASITPGQPVSIYPYQSDGGILLDTKGSSSGTTSQSITVGSNSNRLLVVFATTKSNGANISGVTYDSVPMTQIDSKSQGSGGAIFQTYSFILVAPATGANTLAITTSTGSCDISWYSLYNCAQSSQPEAHTSAGNITSGTTSLSTIANGALVLSGFFDNTSTGSISGSAAYENLETPSDYIISYDSSPVFPAATSINATVTSWDGHGAILMLSIAPVTAPSNTVVPSSASNSTNQFVNKYTSYIGIAQSSASATGTVTVATGGIDANQLGLIPGTEYYLGNSTGTFSTTAGANTRKAGIAVSTTQILITNIW